MKRLLIFDGNALVHRAYHAIPRLTNRKGELINAVYGFFSVFLKVIKDFNPDFVCVCFDMAAPTFRHEKFKEYKATRKKSPDDLYEQIPKIKSLLEVFHTPIFEREGFEADDAIATISKDPSVQNIESIIVSGDLDVLQLVDKNTKVLTPPRGDNGAILYDEEKIKERFELTPKQIIDFKGLRGDPSDNIPGVAGIGEKTAISLLKEFGSLEKIYEALEKIKPAIAEKLKKDRDKAFFSKMLATVREDVPIYFSKEMCFWGDFKREEIEKAFSDTGFHSLLKRIPAPRERKQEEKKQTSFF